MRNIDLIVIHCSATPNGEWRTAEDIDAMHAARGFLRNPALIGYNAPDLKHIGYHYVIYTSGGVIAGRGLEEIGAHVKGHNARSVGICVIGTDKFSIAQWESLRGCVNATRKRYPKAAVTGHRELSPDIDGDGTVEPAEWLKICPGFSVPEWLGAGMIPLERHLLTDTQTAKEPA